MMKERWPLEKDKALEAKIRISIPTSGEVRTENIHHNANICDYLKINL